jgi:hypothetical protein
MNIDQKLDTCGLACPLPLLKAKQALNRLDRGLVLEETSRSLPNKVAMSCWDRKNLTANIRTG